VFNMREEGIVRGKKILQINRIRPSLGINHIHFHRKENSFWRGGEKGGGNTELAFEKFRGRERNRREVVPHRSKTTRVKRKPTEKGRERESS